MNPPNHEINKPITNNYGIRQVDWMRQTSWCSISTVSSKELSMRVPYCLCWFLIHQKTKVAEIQLPLSKIKIFSTMVSKFWNSPLAKNYYFFFFFLSPIIVPYHASSKSKVVIHQKKNKKFKVVLYIQMLTSNNDSIVVVTKVKNFQNSKSNWEIFNSSNFKLYNNQSIIIVYIYTYTLIQ